MQARSNIFQHLQKVLNQSTNEQQSNETDFNAISRRRFLHNSLVAGAGMAMHSAALPFKAFSSQNRIAIVGAGLAGLTAGYYLQKSNANFTIYEGGKRFGGRAHTLKDFAAPGTWTELGGQYLDTSHLSILQLCKELDIPLLDVKPPGEMELLQLDYFFNGKRYTDADIIKEFASVAPYFEKDIATFPEVVGYKTPQFSAIDNTTLEEYIEKSGASPLIRQLLKAAFTCEYGQELSKQSALNMIYLLPPKVNGQKFEAWGESDERYIVQGGTATIPTTLAAKMPGKIELEHLLEAILPDGQGFKLIFRGGKEVKADVAIITIPFSMLREVDIRVPMPPHKKQAIQELGYGMNSKMVLGYQKRVWRDQGYTGNVFNETLQNAWEDTQMQNDNKGPGSITMFLGGEVARDLRLSDRKKMLKQINTIFPGSKKVHNGKKLIFNWHTFPLTKGSYTCYLPGQWTAFGGAEPEPVGNLFFAGEHCSLQSQGFMDGAVESGKAAAEAVVARKG